MNYDFRLSVVKVHCLSDQVGEWGKDELRLLAYGVSRRGTPFATGYRVLGSYSDGDVRTDGELRIVLHEAALPPDGLDGLLYVWLVEEDGGGVRRAAPALDASFLSDYAREAAHLVEVGFPRDCIPFTAFYKAILPHAARVEQAATDGRNDDLYQPGDYYLRFAPSGPTGLGHSSDVVVQRSKKLGHYRVTLRATWRARPTVLG